MLHFFKKVQLLNYIFPPYQPNNRNGLRKSTKSDFNMTEYNFNENLNEDASIDSDEMQIDRIYQRL